MADADIYHAVSGPGAKQWGRRVYYAGCHRQGGDYAWMRDNLSHRRGCPPAPGPHRCLDVWRALEPADRGRACHAARARQPSSTPPAEKMLLYQRAVGGWPKALGEVKVSYAARLSAGARAGLLDSKNQNDATIDNDATTREINYLLQAFQKTNNPAYRRRPPRPASATCSKCSTPTAASRSFTPT